MRRVRDDCDSCESVSESADSDTESADSDSESDSQAGLGGDSPESPADSESDSRADSVPLAWAPVFSLLVFPKMQATRGIRSMATAAANNGRCAIHCALLRPSKSAPR